MANPHQPDKTGPVTRGRNLAQNTALIAVCRLTTAVSALLVIPVVVGRLGVAGYGTWEAMAAVASLSLMFQGAISSTAIWQASTAFGSGRMDDVHRAGRIGISATLLVFVLIVPLAWLGRDLLVGLLNVGSVSEGSARIILPALIGMMVLGGIPESLAAVVTAQQRAGLPSMCSAAGLLGNYLVVVLALSAGYGLWSLLLGYGTGLILQSAALYWLVARMSGPILLLPVWPKQAELRELGSYYGLILTGFLSSALRDQTDKIILAAMASPLWVGYYAIAARLAGLVLEVNRFIYVPTIAAAAAFNAMHEWSSIQRLFTRTMTFGAIASGSVAVLVAAHYDRLVVLWLGEDGAGVVPLLLLLLVGNTAAVMLTGAGTAICRGINRVGIETLYVTVNLVSNVILTILLVRVIGPIGSVIASSLTWTVSAMVFVLLLHRRVDLPSEGTRNAARAIAAVIAAAALMRAASVFLPPATTRLEALLSLVVLVPVTMALYLVALHVSGALTFQQLAARRHFLPLSFGFRQVYSWAGLRTERR